MPIGQKLSGLHWMTVTTQTSAARTAFTTLTTETEAAIPTTLWIGVGPWPCWEGCVHAYPLHLGLTETTFFRREGSRSMVGDREGQVSIECCFSYGMGSLSTDCQWSTVLLLSSRTMATVATACPHTLSSREVAALCALHCSLGRVTQGPWHL